MFCINLFHYVPSILHAAYYVFNGSKPLDDSPAFSLIDADPLLKKKADDSFKVEPKETK